MRKNGHTQAGAQKYYCCACGCYGTLVTQEAQRAEREALVMRLAQERLSQRAIARIAQISRNTVIATIKKKVIAPRATTFPPLRERPILELDELWSYVGSKAKKVWIWLALERQTRRIVGLAMGDRSDDTCRAMWLSLPPDYRKRAVLYSDFWASYANVLPSKRLRQVGKDSGETAHIERFNNTLRQFCANLVRKTLSFRKQSTEHERRFRLFIDHYNATLPV